MINQQQITTAIFTFRLQFPLILILNIKFATAINTYLSPGDVISRFLRRTADCILPTSWTYQRGILGYHVTDCAWSWGSLLEECIRGYQVRQRYQGYRENLRKYWTNTLQILSRNKMDKHHVCNNFQFQRQSWSLQCCFIWT